MIKMLKNIPLFSKRLIIIGLLMGLLPAQAAMKKEYGDWLLQCDNKCVIKQGLRNPNQPGITYGIEILRVQNRLVASFNFPLGIYLPRGIGVLIGNLVQDVPVTTCVPAGCSALLPLSNNLINSIKNSSSIKVRFYLKDNHPNELNFSTNGFPNAIKALTSS